MRYQEIPKPKSVIVRVAYWITRKKFGKSITPLKVIYSRKPPLLFLGDSIEKYQTRKIDLSENLKCLIQCYCSILNGCHFCNDLSLAKVISGKLGEKKFLNISSWENDHANAFTSSERAVLRFIKEYSDSKKTSDDTFQGLTEHFNEEQVIDIVTLNAIENFYNALNIPFGIESDGLAELQRKKLTQNQ